MDNGGELKLGDDVAQPRFGVADAQKAIAAATTTTGLCERWCCFGCDQDKHNEKACRAPRAHGVTCDAAM